jgi:hypothetical protein
MKRHILKIKGFCIFNCGLLILLIFSTNSVVACPENYHFILFEQQPEELSSNDQKEIFHNENISAFKEHKYYKQNIDDAMIDLIQLMDESIILNYLQTLVSFGPRVTGTPACTQTGQWIYSEFHDMGLDVRYHNWSHGGESGQNIEATLPGANETSDDIYVICAHYDTVSGSPGADDDGSGVAAVLSAAELLSQYIVNHTIRFITFSGEEQGLYGSYQYAKQASIDADKIIAVLNADMIGYAINQYQGDYIDIYYNTQSTWIVDFIDNIADKYFDYIDLEVIYGGYSWGSDHSSFWQWGYDAVQYKEYETNPYYHTSNDIIENMNISYVTKCAKLFLAVAAEFIQISSPNQPPNTPMISGKRNGEAGIEYVYNFTAFDPNDDNLYYYIDWGDNQFEEWIGPYESSEEITISHIWVEQGDYKIRVKVKDIEGAESDWANLEISMPVNQHYPTFRLISTICFLIS